MNQILKIFITSISLLFFSCSDAIVGNGDVVTESRPVTKFNNIKVQGDFNIHLQQGKNYNILLKLDKNLLSNTTTEIHGDLLSIKSKSTVLHSNSKDIYITFKDLSSLSLVGSNYVECANTLNISDFKLKSKGLCNIKLKINSYSLSINLEGSSDAIIEGASNTLNVDMKGYGHFDSMDLYSENVVLDLSGTIKSKVFASEYLDVDLSGVGKVEYKGNPEIIQELSRNARLMKLE